jgi:competence protein ComEC
LKEGDRISGFGEVHFLVLHPPDSYHPSLHPDNNRSLVTLVSFGAFSMILPGDLEKAGIQKLLKDHQPFPRVDWLMAPHHGRASGEPLLCAQGFHPRFVVFSDWRDYPDSRKTYESLLDGSTVLATAETGAIELEVNASGEGRYRCFREGLWHSFKIQSNPPQNIDKHFTNPL